MNFMNLYFCVLFCFGGKYMKTTIRILTIIVLALLIVCLLASLIVIFTGEFPLFDTDEFDSLIGMIGALSTVFLGIVANWQNQRLVKLENDRDKVSKSCSVFVNKTDNIDSAIGLSNDLNTRHCYNESEYYVYFQLSNCGEAPLKKIEVNFSNKSFVSHVCLPKDVNKCVKILLPKNFDYEDVVEITFISSYDEKTYGDFKIFEDSMEDNYFYTIKYYHYYADKKGDF